MANSSQVSFKGHVFTTNGHRRLSPPDFANSAAPNAASIVKQIVLANGLNTIVIPTGARGVLIEFADGSTVTKTLKGVTGDTGILLDPTGWHILRFSATPPASFAITASAADTGYTTYFTFF